MCFLQNQRCGSALLRGGEALVDLVPVDGVPPGFEVVGALVLVCDFLFGLMKKLCATTVSAVILQNPQIAQPVVRRLGHANFGSVHCLSQAYMSQLGKCLEERMGAGVRCSEEIFARNGPTTFPTATAQKGIWAREMDSSNNAESTCDYKGWPAVWYCRCATDSLVALELDGATAWNPLSFVNTVRQLPGMPRNHDPQEVNGLA